MNVLADLRREMGMSQRDMALRAGISFRGLQFLEQTDHNWRIDTLAKVAEALNLPGQGIDLVVDDFLRTRPDSIADVSMRMLLDGLESWKLHLFDFVDAFRTSHDARLVRDPPVHGLEARLAALCASTVEALCAEHESMAPPWCAGVPALPCPWFVAGIENLKASALVESPAWFRKRNIFVLGNFLSRA